MVTLIESLINRVCITINENSNIKDLVTLLNKNKIGCVVVVSDNDYPVGIVSERDLIRKYDKILNSDDIQISDIMTKPLITCQKNSTSKDLMEKMTYYKIRHIPIIEGNKLLGIISIGDVVKRLLENYAKEAKLLREYINN